MAKIHIIHNKKLKDVKQRGKVLPVLEKSTFKWAEKNNPKAYQATVKIQGQAEDASQSKYFNYLRRLLELRLEVDEDFAKTLEFKEVSELLNIESLNIPRHISCTQIAMYDGQRPGQGCPRKWYWRYALGIKTPKTAALHFGIAVDEAINFYFEEKIKGTKAPRSAVYSCFYEHFNTDKDKVIWGNDDARQLEKNGPAILDAYLDEYGESTKPVKGGVQTEVIVNLDGGILIGYIDILEEKTIVDTKTAKKKWVTNGRYPKQKDELQPKAYSLWYLEENEEVPSFRYQIVTKETDEKGNPTPQVQTIELKLKKYEVESFRHRIQKIWDDIMRCIKIGKSAFPAQAEYGPLLGRGIGKQQPFVLCCKEYCDYEYLCTKDGLRVPTKWIKKTVKDGITIPGHHVYED